MRHKVLVIAGLLVALMLSTGELAHAAVPTTLPTGCVLKPGQFQVLRLYGGAHNAVRVTTAAVDCSTATRVDAITESIIMSRYEPSTHTWIPERRVNFYVEPTAPPSDRVAPAIDMHVYCNVPGARMAMQVIDSFFFLDYLQAQVTYPGRTTDICAPVPAGCVVQPGSDAIYPIKGAHHAVRATSVGVRVRCDVACGLDHPNHRPDQVLGEHQKVDPGTNSGGHLGPDSAADRYGHLLQRSGRPYELHTRRHVPLPPHGSHPDESSRVSWRDLPTLIPELGTGGPTAAPTRGLGMRCPRRGSVETRQNGTYVRGVPALALLPSEATPPWSRTSPRVLGQHAEREAARSSRDGVGSSESPLTAGRLDGGVPARSDSANGRRREAALEVIRRPGGNACTHRPVEVT